MCGINGILGLNNELQASEIIAVMNKAIAHRGPDNTGSYVAPMVALGHVRLSIIDLSEAGNQPFYSSDKRFVLVFNGEIYNYKSLKSQLNDYDFKTSTDTEVIIAAYLKWGTSFLQHLNGMFAFVLHDTLEKQTIIARDRLGIKPVYYYQKNGVLAFASEIRALIKSKLFKPTINALSLNDYLRYQTVHAPNTILSEVKMLMPGTYIFIDEKQTQFVTYWDIKQSYSKEAALHDYNEVKSNINNLLFEAVERRLVADVPFGAFLSGGIDSSIIVGMMSQISSSKVSTFSVTFAEEAFSEAKYSNLIAKKFNTNHTEIKLSPDDFLEAIPAALKAMDHPSGDGPNTFIVSKVTKASGIKMALSGLGGDEVFAGYDVFKRLSQLKKLQLFSILPSSIRNLPAKALMTLKPSVTNKKLVDLLSMPNFDLSSTYPLVREVLDAKVIKDILAHKENIDITFLDRIKAIEQSDLPFLSKISYAEINTYMQNILLRDTDQMSMAHALEVRVPFLDYKLVEYVMGVKDEFKYPQTPKKLLVESVGELIPSSIVNRPKMGFTLPWEHWLKNELKQLSQEHIERLSQRSFFNADAVKQLWDLFITNDKSITWSRMWPLIVLENWMEENGIE